MGRKPSFLSLTDLFCGAGGASIGAEEAGLKLVLGINHWQRAIETHASNFPNAAHDCRDVSETHPSRYGSTHLLWASPECPTWSQARGKRRNFLGQLPLDESFEALPTEAEEKSRVTMWDVVRYSEYHGYDAVVVENVVDLMPWYLLPVWLQAMATLGYQHRALFLNSMFFGVPQSRDRVYFVFWKKGNKAPDLEFRPRSWCPRCGSDVEAVQTYKKPAKVAGLASQVRYRAQYIFVCPSCGQEAFPYVMPAAIAIDWSVRGERIGAKKRPLATATMARIQAGIDRYWRPVVLDTLRDPKYRDAGSDPLPTQTARQSLGLAQPPLLAHLRGTHEAALDSSTKRADEPMGTVSAGGIHHALVEGPEPLMVKQFTARGNDGQMSHPVSEPLGSITAVDHHGLLVHPGSGGAGRVRSSREPLPTQTTETRPMLVSYYGREYTARPVSRPMGTLTGDPRHALVTPAVLVPLDQRGPDRHNKSRSVDVPLRTQTSIQADGLITPPLIVNQRFKNVPRPADEPLPTIPTRGNQALVVKAAGSTYDPGAYKRVRTTDEPLWTQTGTAEAAVVEQPDAFLSSYYGASHVNRDVDEPMGTLTAKERHALIEGAEEIDINDCFFRMLMPREIQLGMAFPADYIVTGTQREQVKQSGQAVTPPVPSWIWQRIVESLR